MYLLHYMHFLGHVFGGAPLDFYYCALAYIMFGNIDLVNIEQ